MMEFKKEKQLFENERKMHSVNYKILERDLLMKSAQIRNKKNTLWIIQLKSNL